MQYNMFTEQCSGVFGDHFQQDHRRCSESSPGGLLSGKYQVGTTSEDMKYPCFEILTV